MKIKHTLTALVAPFLMHAQNVMTPETLWTLNKIGVSAVSPDQSSLIYSVATTDLKTEKSNKRNFFLNVGSAEATAIDLGKKSIIQWDKNGIYSQEGDFIYISKDAGKTWTEFFKAGKVDNIVISPDGKKIAFSKEVLVEKVLGKDKYADTPKSTAHIYTDLNHRHWDYYNEGKYNHVFVVNVADGIEQAKDLLEGKAWDTPQRPFGGADDFVWSPDSTKLLYVTKPMSGIDYAFSTNTDIFSYEIATGETVNLTPDNKGYDVAPKFSPDGKYLYWLSMERDGYEADKNNLMVMDWKTGKKNNLTKDWDESVTGSVFWARDSKTVYFTSAWRGTQQLFALNPKNSEIKQITRGNFDLNDIYAQHKNSLLISRTDFNHNPDLYAVDVRKGTMTPVTEVNKENYAKIAPSRSELKMVKTTDGKEMGVWFIYPPNFDESKKYPTLLYCQGGPQSALT